MTTRARPHRLARTAMTLLVVAAMLAVSLPALVAARPGASTPLPSAAVPGAALDPALSLPFAARAGFHASLLSEVAGGAPATGNRSLVVTFLPRDPSLFTPPATGSPPLSVAEVANRYGLTTAEYNATQAYFRSEGLTVTQVWPDRMALTLRGPVPAIDRSFSTYLLEGSYLDRTVTYPAVPPALPPGIQSRVAAVTGLESGVTTFTLPLSNAFPLDAGVAPALGDSNLVTPAIARSIYDVSSLYSRNGSPAYATSEGIAIVLWGEGYSPLDVTTFFQQDYPSTFPQPTVVPEPVAGAPAPSNSASSDPCPEARELTLDLEWSGSMAPGATLYPVYAPYSGGSGGCQPLTSDLADALHTAVLLPVAAVSMSFGTPEFDDAGLRAAFDTYLAEAVQRGIVPFAATGDLGGYSQAGCQGVPAPQYPSTSPEVIAVGGTDVVLQRNIVTGAITGFQESAWNESGGGFSTQYAAPAWQNLGNPMRGTPDVSASSAEDYLYFQGQGEVAAGTSFATPLWAGIVTEMTAEFGRSLGPLGPRLYTIGTGEPTGRAGIGLADITSGSTCLGPATPGWDQETGWGSPRAFVLYEDLTATFVRLSVNATPSPVGPGGTVTIVAHLANATTLAAIPNVPVDVSLVSSTNLGPCTGTFGSASPTTDASGNVSVSMTVPACYLGASADVSVTVLSNGYYGTNSTTVPVNLLAFVPFLSGLTTYPASLLGFALIMTVAGAIGYGLGRPRRASDARVASVVPAPPAGTGGSPGPSTGPRFGTAPPPGPSPPAPVPPEAGAPSSGDGSPPSESP